MIALRRRWMRRLAKWIADIVTPLEARDARWERKNGWLRRAGLRIGESGVAVGTGFRCIDGNEENLSIGDYANIGHNVHIWNFDRVEIGRFAMVAADVMVTNGWHDRDSLVPGSGPLRIGNGCWIGAAARIVGPVTVGDNAIVGAGAVVVRDVEPGTIVAGVPAKVIGRRALADRAWHLDDVWFSTISFEAVESPEARP